MRLSPRSRRHLTALAVLLPGRDGNHSLAQFCGL